MLEQPLEHRPVSLAAEPPTAPFESNMEKDAFLANVAKSKEYIRAGDIIQVVGSQRFSTEVKADPLDVYRAVRSINPSPYKFQLEFDGYSLVGASPEIHERIEEGQVQNRPNAATRPRGKTAEEDVVHEKDLLSDPKERAEHVMLVDLARNDIGRVCEYGSVQVADLMVIERYSHVMHIVSSVTGQLCADKTPYDLLRTTFPAGTLTGAPKIRAMQIISEFEQTTRGPTVARSVTSVSTATSTAASPSAPPCSRTAKPTSKPAAAGSTIRSPKPNFRKPSTKLKP